MSPFHTYGTNMRIALFAVALSVSACAFAGDQKAVAVHSWPSCLGMICYGDELPDAKHVVATFGGVLHRTDQDEQSFCYSDGKRFLKLTVHNEIPAYISSAQLSNQRICSGGTHSKIPLRSLKTREGLVLGQSFDQVLATYGPPNVIQYDDRTVQWDAELLSAQLDAIKDDSILQYGPTSADTLFEASIHIRAGRIVGIELSNAE